MKTGTSTIFLVKTSKKLNVSQAEPLGESCPEPNRIPLTFHLLPVGETAFLFSLPALGWAYPPGFEKLHLSHEDLPPIHPNPQKFI